MRFSPGFALIRGTVEKRYFFYNLEFDMKGNALLKSIAIMLVVIAADKKFGITDMVV